MRALRTSKTWWLLTLNALLILAGASAFASQCCCAAMPVQFQQTENHHAAVPKAKSAAIVLDCCASKTADRPQIAAAPHHSQAAPLAATHLKRVCACVTPEITAAVPDRCAHPVSHLAAILPAHRAPQLRPARAVFSATTFLSPPAPDNKRAAGRSPPTV